ncbi:OmpA family protein [Rhodoferax sediminis]|uniref:OmpA family protein n=1 Tax=Rhodoferax sediminis TaxID=2509614 RepID=A0A515DEA0_9BURK|nr:OmpA family protein [Rhodoferax sediminis]QDL38725.1 OmpA family protein [Rhodoferax sediminis]
MTKSPSRSVASPVRWVLPLCAALLISSCSLLRRSQTEAPSLPHIAEPAPHLAQMNFGRQAEFGLCTPPVCPAVTPKTLAPPLPHATLPTLRPLVGSSTLDAGEEIMPPSSGTTTRSPSPSSRAPESISKTVTVHFRFGDASLSPADKLALDSAVAVAPDARHIVISGRTYSIGPANANALLATARARTVNDYLRTEHPHLASVLKLDAQGTCCYVASNDTERGRGLNRRVDVLFSSDGEQPH